MKSKILMTIVFATLGLISQAQAGVEEDLAKSKNCFACHSQKTKVVGPAFDDVRAKYAKDSTALDRLSKKVKAGGSGVWGTIPMPPNALVSEAEAKTLVKWVLAK